MLDSSRAPAACIRLPGRGFVAAAFRHRSSRAGDPLLHTHVVVANATQAQDGRWTALDGRQLYRHAKTAGYLYQAALRAELSAASSGCAGRPSSTAAPIVEGVPRRVIEHFSQRRAEILELMAARGETSARAAQVATLETRRRKDYGVPVDRLRAEWRARAAEHGLDRAALSSRPAIRVAERRLDARGLAERLEGADGLTRERSTFTRRDVLQAFAEHARDGATVAAIESPGGCVPRARRDRRARAAWPASAATARASCCSSSTPRSSARRGRARSSRWSRSAP